MTATRRPPTMYVPVPVNVNGPPFGAVTRCTSGDTCTASP